MSPQPGLCAVRDHHRSPAPEYPGEPGGGVSGDHHSATRASSQLSAIEARRDKPYPSKVSLDGASAISTPPTNLRKKVEIVSGCRDGRALRASLRSRRPAWAGLETHNAAPAEYLAGRRCTHTYSGYGSAVPASSVDDRPEAVLLRRAKLLFIADTVGGVSAGTPPGTTLLPSGKSEGFGHGSLLMSHSRWRLAIASIWDGDRPAAVPSSHRSHRALMRTSVTRCSVPSASASFVLPRALATTVANLVSISLGERCLINSGLRDSGELCGNISRSEMTVERFALNHSCA